MIVPTGIYPMNGRDGHCNLKRTIDDRPYRGMTLMNGRDGHCNLKRTIDDRPYKGIPYER